MRNLIIFLIMFVFVDAKELSVVKAECTKEKHFVIVIDSPKLYLSEDAVIDNLGGYVDIFDTKYYLKTDKKVYYIDGEVINLGDTHLFSSIAKTQERYIRASKLYKLKEESNVIFIQKIRLKDEQKIATQKLRLSFDTKSFEEAQTQCSPLG
ncbi:MAG: hypothetical protein U9N49_10640 [Campylobacterota bacterium]|nr:hypothetical protein [Campylobacterota bacterium]